MPIRVIDIRSQMDSVPVKFLEDTFRLSSGVARCLNTWRDLSGLYSHVSSQLSKHNFVSILLHIWTINNSDKIVFRYKYVGPFSGKALGKPFVYQVDKTELFKTKKQFSTLLVIVAATNNLHNCRGTTWDDQKLLEILELSRYFPFVCYLNRTNCVEEIYQILLERNLKPAGEIEVLNKNQGLPLDFLRSQLGNGYFRCITIPFNFDLQEIERVTEVVHLFLRSDLLMLNIYRHVIDLLKKIFNTYFDFPGETNAKGKMITFETQRSLFGLKISMLVGGESWRTEETVLDEATFVHVWDEKSGRGFKWKVFSNYLSSEPTEIWFV